MWNPSSPTRDLTCVPCSGSSESSPTGPPRKPPNLFFDESFSTDKRQAEGLAGVLFWESLIGSCPLTIWPLPRSAPGWSLSQHRTRQKTTGPFRNPFLPQGHVYSLPGRQSARVAYNSKSSISKCLPVLEEITV